MIFTQIQTHRIGISHDAFPSSNSMASLTPHSTQQMDKQDSKMTKSLSQLPSMIKISNSTYCSQATGSAATIDTTPPPATGRRKHEIDCVKTPSDALQNL